MQYSQEHLKTMVFAKFGGQTECIMGNSKIVNVVKIAEKDEYSSREDKVQNRMGGSYPVKGILSDLFSFLCVPYT